MPPPATSNATTPNTATPSATTPQPAAPHQVTPRGLLGVALLGCVVAALLGSSPLATWAGSLDLAFASRAADTWRDLTRQLGLDRPYDTLREAVRSAVSARFGPGD